MASHPAWRRSHETGGRARHELILKIAHVTATFPPYWGGTGNVAYHNARVLHQRGHDVTVYTAALSGRAPLSFPFTTQYLKAPFRIGNAPLTPALVSQLRDFDLIHLHWPYIFGAELTCLASRLHHTPFVMTYHNDLLAPGARGTAFRIYQATSQPLVLRLAAGIIVTSLDYARHSHLARIGARAGEAREVPNGVDVETFKPGAGPDHAYRRSLGIPPDVAYALFVGAMDRAHFFKGVPVLLEAMTHVPDMHVVLVGNGDLRARFELQADTALSGRAHFVQSVELPRLVELYQGAAVTVLPSTTQGEAFGMVLLESFACGTPVIATNLPGMRSVVSTVEDGLLVPPGMARELASALQRMMESDTARAHMGMHGRQKVETRYRWEAVVDRLESVYEDVLGRGDRCPISLPTPGDRV